MEAETHHGTKDLYKSGGSTAVGLPKKYLDNNNLGPGKGVEMIERGIELVIRPAGGNDSGTGG